MITKIKAVPFVSRQLDGKKKELGIEGSRKSEWGEAKKKKKEKFFSFRKKQCKKKKKTNRKLLEII